MSILSNQPDRRQCKDIYKPAPESRYAILFYLSWTEDLPPLRLRKLILQLQPRRNIHTHQLLNQQFGRIRNGHLHYPSRRLAPLTPVQIPHEPARLTDVDFMTIRRDHQALEQELRGSVCDKTVTFHFSETQTTVARASFGGLPGEHCARAAGTGMHLVLDHVL